MKREKKKERTILLSAHVNRILSPSQNTSLMQTHIWIGFIHFQSQKPPLLPIVIKGMNTAALTIAAMEKQFHGNM